MKHLILALSLVAFLATYSIASAESYDSEQATIQKAGANSAKVMIGKSSSTVPVTFADGASWDCVKDHYEVSDAVGEGLKNGTMMISVGSDGTVSFTKCNCSKSKKK